MPDFGFPSAHHDDVIELDTPDLKRAVETTLAELGWSSAEDTVQEGEYHQHIVPDGTWWTTRWKDGLIKIVRPNRVEIRIEKFALGDIVDWRGECTKMVNDFRQKLLEVAARGDSPYRTT